MLCQVIDGLRSIQSFYAKLHVRPGGKPTRTVSYAIRGVIEDELCCLECKGILEKVTYREWANPNVAVPKADGCFRYAETLRSL